MSIKTSSRVYPREFSTYASLSISVREGNELREVESLLSALQSQESNTSKVNEIEISMDTYGGYSPVSHILTVLCDYLENPCFPRGTDIDSLALGNFVKLSEDDRNSWERLRGVLVSQLPSCTVHTLLLDGEWSNEALHDIVIPVLASPTSCIKNLIIHYVSIDRIAWDELRKTMMSENCLLEGLFFVGMTVAQVLSTKELICQLAEVLYRSLTRRCSKLKTVYLRSVLLLPEFFGPLYIGMTHTNNQLKCLEIRSNQMPQQGLRQLCQALTHPNSKLSNLRLYNGVPPEILRFIASSIAATKLETLLIDEDRTRPGDGLIALAESLEKTPSNRLREFHYWGNEITDEGIEAWTKSLRSKNNRLRVLRLYFPLLRTPPGLRSFLRALRVSNVVSFSSGSISFFFESFNSDFVQVMYAIMSARDIPRIGCDAAVRMLPLNHFLSHIAETLDWNWERLSV